MSDDTGSELDTDDELRALLRAGDPARSLSPADPAALASLLEDIMGADLEISPATPDARQPHRRTPTTWLVAAAAVAAIAAGGGFVISGMGGGGDAGPSAAGPKPSGVVSTAPDANAPVAGETTQLKGASKVTKCVAEPTPEM